MNISVRHTWLRRASRGPGIVAAILIAVAAAMPAAAQHSFPATHVAELDAAGEVPVSGSSGSGLAILRYDPVEGRLDYRLSVTRLLAPIAEARFHAGKRGEAGPALRTIGFPAGSSTAEGSWTLSPQEREQLLNDRIYIDVYTQGGQSGEIRGQVTPIHNAVAFGMSGQNEIPPAMTSNGVGEGRFWIDPASGTGRYHVSWRNLTGHPTAIQIARGRPGTSGAAISTMPLATADSSVYGVWTSIAAEDIGALRTGAIYLNVLTDSFPQGEIRAKIVQVNTFTAAITADNVVPPASGSAAGTGVVRLLEEFNAGGAFLLGSFIVDDFSGAITEAHLHRGGASETGDSILTLDRQGETMFLPPPGYIQLYGADFSAFFSGRVYADFHTAAHGQGEARGQLIPSPLNFGTAPAGVAVIAGAAPARLEVTIDPDGTRAHLLIGPALAGPGGRVEIVSPLGARVMLLNAGREHLAVPVGSLAGGLYMIRLVDAGGSTVACGRLPVVR